VSVVVAGASPRRRDVPAMHSSASLTDRTIALAPPAIPPGGKAAPSGGQLGSFMFVKNSRFDPAAPTADNPRFWVGRVAEIMSIVTSAGYKKVALVTDGSRPVAAPEAK
jgi:hypothetical protein